jgi:hypothetical protein
MKGVVLNLSKKVLLISVLFIASAIIGESQDENRYYNILCSADVFYEESITIDRQIPIFNRAFYYLMSKNNPTLFECLFRDAKTNEARIYALIGMRINGANKYKEFTSSINKVALLKINTGDLIFYTKAEEIIRQIENGNILLSLFRYINTNNWTITMPDEKPRNIW